MLHHHAPDYQKYITHDLHWYHVIDPVQTMAAPSFQHKVNITYARCLDAQRSLPTTHRVITNTKFLDCI